jgi:hypothetical protein
MNEDNQPSQENDAVDPVAAICSHRLSIEAEGYTYAIPCCQNNPLDEFNPGINRLVIVIHGAVRNADEYFQGVLEAGVSAGGADKISLIIAPQFIIEEDIKAFQLGGDMAYWSENGWKGGDNSKTSQVHLRQMQVSSFKFLDSTFERLVAGGCFPNVSQVVIVGHSAGGQFVNRYAAGGGAEKVFDPLGVPVRYIIANPSSYLYFDAQRRVPGTISQFSLPDSSACPEYNKYKYGLEELNSYMAAVGTPEILNRYPHKEIAYLQGGEDNDPEAYLLDRTCEAMLQGEQRQQRGLIYYNYLQYLFGDLVQKNQAIEIIPGVGHSFKHMFTSIIGLKYIFDFHERN